MKGPTVEICTPGERLALTADHEPGQGTHISGSYICASLVGSKSILPPTTSNTKPRIQVTRSGTQPLIPSIGDIVTAKVVTINPRLASLDILCIGTRPVDHRYSGILRSQDIRATEIDKVQVHLCFRPGDIVRAQVLSLGDSRSYYLTTAKNELGVIYAKSLAGVAMIPIKWNEMQCPKTKAIEYRKVAKVLNTQ